MLNVSQFIPILLISFFTPPPYKPMCIATLFLVILTIWLKEILFCSITIVFEVSLCTRIINMQCGTELVHEMEIELAYRRWCLYHLQHIFWVILTCVLLSLQAFQLVTIEAALQKLCLFCVLTSIALSLYVLFQVQLELSRPVVVVVSVRHRIQ